MLHSGQFCNSYRILQLMPRLRSPIWWYGGKGNMVAKLLKFIPEHRIYVEPFGGGASLLLAKEPSLVEVYNDLDSGLVNFFRVLRDPDKFCKLYHLACLTPYSREEYNYCKDNWDKQDDEIVRAYQWFVAIRQSFNGSLNVAWSYTVTASFRGMAGHVSAWLSILEMLPVISDRLLTVQIDNKDAIEVIKTYDTPNTFFYLDPPYIHSTRAKGSRRVYNHEMTLEDHLKLLRTVLNSKGKFMISGYLNNHYHKMLKNWNRQLFNTGCYAAGRTKNSGLLGKDSVMKHQKRTEVIWYNYNLKGDKNV